ncbi:NB-ARC domain-containing protein [Pseudomonas psychrophila]|uniref:hypothetical protein n=1 Tax=Pseudomonas psychrophila TaxID=122355 RepID=UPI0037F28BCF
MREAQRVEHLERLIEGIKIVGGGSVFERFGAKFLDHHLHAGLVHRGLNTQLNPIGGTVDSVDDAGEIAAEYSIDKQYFHGHWNKPSNDLLHVLRKHPNVQNIYLVSSQTATVQEVNTAKERVSAWPGLQNRTIHYYDARRIAEVIVDELLLDDAAVRALVEHLPVLERVLNEHQATLILPAVDPCRVELRTVEQAIETALNDANPVVAISGLPGSGKSDAAAAYVNGRGNRYQTPIWVEGAELTRVSDLASLNLWRGGADLNVAGMLRTRHCLLVIDDLPPHISLNDLKPLVSPGSHILVTRRETEVGDIEIPALTPSEAREILDRNMATPCPEAVLKALMTVVGGHPLSLALVNKAVSAGIPWSEIAEDCGSLTELADGRERLADRILGHLKSLLSAELAVFEWVGQSSCDRRFLRSIIRLPGMLKIGGQGLLAADRPNVVRLHDVVYASLKVQGWLTPERAADLDQQFEHHLTVLIEEESLALRVLATNIRTKLETAAKTRFSPAVLVALLTVWRPEEMKPDVLESPEAYLDRLKERATPVSYVEVRLILEAIESWYRFEKVKSVEAAKDQLEIRLSLFPRLLALTFSHPRSLAEAQHHWGKALKILKHTEAAAEQFEAVMAGPIPLEATRLQLIRLYGDERAVALADEILTAAQTPQTVSSSVVLGVVENLSWAKGSALNNLFDKHTELIEREIIEAADAGLEQAYTALASVARHWSWHDPARLKRVFDTIPVPSAETADDQASGAIGEVLLKLAKSQWPPNRDQQHEAVRYYNSIIQPAPYQLQKHGEVLIDLQQFPEAETVLRRIPDHDADAFVSHRLSQVRLALTDSPGALILIDAAIRNLKEDQQKYLGTFLAHRYKVRNAQADPDAVADLDKAIALTPPGKYRSSLERQRGKIDQAAPSADR